MSIIYASLSDPTVKAQYRDALDRHLGPDAILAGPAADALREHRLDPQVVSWLQKLSTEGTRIITDTYSLAERPDLVDQFWGVGGDWPTFMLKDPVARTRYELATELFPDLHNQIGGVEVCTTRPLVDNELGTILPNAGTQLINGQTALSYVRARKVDAEGTGDYGRIKRQQRFLSSLLRKAMSTDVLFNFGKLSGFINGFTAATFGQNMNSDSLITLGQSLQGLSAGRVTFITVPTTGTREGNEVPNLTEITNVFHAIIDDTPLPGEQGSGPPATTSATSPPPTPAAKPGGSAQIQVLNATIKTGLAGTTASKLTDFGYTVGTVGTASAT